MSFHAPLEPPSEKLWKKFQAEGTDAHRICTLDGAWIERLGGDLLLNYQDESALPALLEWCGGLPESVGFSPQRVFGRHLPVRNQERLSPVLIAGDPALPLQTVVAEAGVRFGLDFSAGYSTGLFLDQRLNRAWVRQNAMGRLLNTFSYTCSFSVCAALAGAETLSIDLSRKSLSRGEANFVLNGLDPTKHRFFAADVRESLPRLARKAERFDTIILDPPTFSTSHARGRFRVEDDMGELVEAALEVAAPRARLLLSTNCTRLDVRALERIGRQAMKVRRRSGSFLPCASPEDFPRGEGASCLWLQLAG
jgi:23S rRNA (cytosine1962-C5)-methyltransferase